MVRTMSHCSICGGIWSTQEEALACEQECLNLTMRILWPTEHHKDTSWDKHCVVSGKLLRKRAYLPKEQDRADIGEVIYEDPDGVFSFAGGLYCRQEYSRLVEEFVSSHIRNAADEKKFATQLDREKAKKPRARCSLRNFN